MESGRDLGGMCVWSSTYNYNHISIWIKALKVGLNYDGTYIIAAEVFWFPHIVVFSISPILWLYVLAWLNQTTSLSFSSRLCCCGSLDKILCSPIFSDSVLLWLHCINCVTLLRSWNCTWLQSSFRPCLASPVVWRSPRNPRHRNFTTTSHRNFVLLGLCFICDVISQDPLINEFFRFWGNMASLDKIRIIVASVSSRLLLWVHLKPRCKCNLVLTLLETHSFEFDYL